MDLPHRPARRRQAEDESVRETNPQKKARKELGLQTQTRDKLKSCFEGYEKHSGPGLSAPYDRRTEFTGEEAAEVQLQNLYKQAIVDYTLGDGRYVARGAFSSSSVQFVVEACATAPSVTLRVRDGPARWDIAFDLFEFETVSAVVFTLAQRSNTVYKPHVEALEKAVKKADPSHKFTDGKYMRIYLKRKNINLKHKSTDYAMFSDERVDWTPPADTKNLFAGFQPFQPQRAKLGKIQQETLNSLATVQGFNIFLDMVEGDVEQHGDILLSIVRRGKDNKFRPDWWWSRHELYAAHGDQDESDVGSAHHFQRFYHPKHLIAGKPRSYPERQPWLQKSTGDDGKKAAYLPVWAKAKTRFSGPCAYRSVYMPALLWEIESTAVIYSRQFNSKQTYAADFESRGDKVLVKIRVRGPNVSTDHGDLQIAPAAGTLIRVTPREIKSGKAVETALKHGFIGHVAEKTERGWDAMVTCDKPPNKNMIPFSYPKGTQVIIEARYSSRQDDLALMAIEQAATRAESERRAGVVTDKDIRVPWMVSGHTGGAHIKQFSKDFYGDWEKKVNQSGPWSNENAAIKVFVTEVLFEPLNPEQKQVYLLGLRGTPKSQLGIQGCPGTGKSKTLSTVALALIAMGYSVCLSAQSNNGVDAVFDKIAQYILANPGACPGLHTGLIVRVGASTIDRRLMTSLLEHWKTDKKKNQDGYYSVPTELHSSIARENIPYTLAYKMASWIQDNPKDKTSTNWRLYAAADARQAAAFETGSARRPGGTSDTRSKTMQDLMTQVLGKPLLYAATAAAIVSRLDVFNEYAQSTEPETLIDVLIFDEASQSTEANFMTAATASLMKELKLVILGGDTKQLPPVIKSSHENPFASVLQMSSLERMDQSSHDSAIVSLVQNYRSHKDIVHLASMLFYKGKMQAARPPNDADNNIYGGKSLLSVVSSMYKIYETCFATNQRDPYNGRIWMIDVPGFSSKPPESHSSYNQNGIHISCLLAANLAMQIGVQHVQIITMYSHEVGIFRESKTLPRGVAVKTVDSFQGLEDVAIILHCSAAFHTRSNPVGHIENEKRLNVALTRAREIMFIVGNVSFWEDRLLGPRNSIDSTGKPRFHMNENAPFRQLLTEARKAKMVVTLAESDRNNLPDKFVKRGIVCKNWPNRFRPVFEMSRQ